VPGLLPAVILIGLLILNFVNFLLFTTNQFASFLFDHFDENEMDSGRQIEKSLNKWLHSLANIEMREKEFAFLKGSIEDSVLHWAKAIDHKAEDSSLENTVLWILMMKKAQTVSSELSCIRQCCESPIEVLMAYSLYIAGKYNNLTVSFRGKICEHNSYDGKFGERLLNQLGHIHISLQKRIDKYRVDFFVTMIIPETVIDRPDGARLLPRVEKSIIIECDGHNFHEKTKVQAKKDKSRDRKLQSLGHQVYHFTGSEIYSNPIEFASEVIENLKDKALKERAPS